MLRIEHLTKTFGEKVAVDDLSLHIAPGEIYGFIGHNGAGKTTTLRSAVGIQSFDSGEIYICGTSIKTDPLACKRQLAYIPDNPDLYDFMSGIIGNCPQRCLETGWARSFPKRPCFSPRLTSGSAGRAFPLPPLNGHS